MLNVGIGVSIGYVIAGCGSWVRILTLGVGVGVGIWCGY